MHRNSHPEMRKIIIASLAAWYDRKELPKIKWSKNKLFNKAVLEQDALGWEQFLFGFLSKKWCKIQDRHLRELSKQQSGRSWMTQFLIQIWEISWTLWIHHNKFKHDNEKSSETYKSKEKILNEEIEEEYRIGHGNYSQALAIIFRRPIQNVIQYSNSNKIKWLCKIWAIRDDMATRGRGITRIRDGSLLFLYERWRKKLKKLWRDRCR